ncbi:MAG: sigma-70 family RNA polymerase sigma factor [Streptosporangiaceae bacterium]|jgi:RNA polymerase sigma factor (sigma-70 family)
MEDPEVVAAIVAGDPAGLAAAYDRYAVPLYSYCRSMLHEPADAADAVQDTFLIAAAKLRGLRDPGKLRPWLYAVARNESLRRLRAARSTTALEEAADVASQSGSLGRQAERADLHKLVRQAIDGLNPRDRDVIELNLGHDLEGDELADALGVSRNHAHALLSRARNQLERALGALIVARTGQQACPELAALLANWDGQLTVLTRKRISRHIERCDSCGERKRRELTPALFAGATPLVAVLPGFRDQLLSTMSDRTPAGLAHRMGAANRAGPFGPTGFPKPLRPLGVSPWHRTLQHSHAVVAGAAASVVAAGVIAVLVISGAHSPSAAGAETTHGAVIGTNGAAPAHGGPSARVGGGLTPAALGPGGSSSSGPLGPLPTAGSAPSGSAPAGAPTSATSPAGSSASAGSTASASPSSTASTASKGSLSVSPGTLDLAAVNGTATGDVTITARGGPVSYSVAVGSALAGKLTVSPSSGSLTAGQSVTVAVTSSSLLGLDGQLTVNPGGQSVTVLLSVGLLADGPSLPTGS